MAKSVDFYFDFGSPAAYLAATQLPHICADTGAELVWKPMLLGGVFQATGNQSPAEIQPKGPYMTTDLKRFAKRYGVPFVHNPHFPINTLLLMRGATGVQMQEPARFGAYVDAVFHAMWVDPKNLNDPATVGAVLAKCGLRRRGPCLRWLARRKPRTASRPSRRKPWSAACSALPPCSSAARCSGAKTASISFAKPCA